MATPHGYDSTLQLLTVIVSEPPPGAAEMQNSALPVPPPCSCMAFWTERSPPSGIKACPARDTPCNRTQSLLGLFHSIRRSNQLLQRARVQRFRNELDYVASFPRELLRLGGTKCHIEISVLQLLVFVSSMFALSASSRQVLVLGVPEESEAEGTIWKLMPYRTTGGRGATSNGITLELGGAFPS